MENTNTVEKFHRDNNLPTPPATEKLIRVPRVMELLGIQKSTVWAWVKSGKIPKGTKLSHKVTVWKESDIIAYINSITA